MEASTIPYLLVHGWACVVGAESSLRNVWRCPQWFTCTTQWFTRTTQGSTHARQAAGTLCFSTPSLVGDTAQGEES